MLYYISSHFLVDTHGLTNKWGQTRDLAISVELSCIIVTFVSGARKGNPSESIWLYIRRRITHWKYPGINIQTCMEDLQLAQPPIEYEGSDGELVEAYNKALQLSLITMSPLVRKSLRWYPNLMSTPMSLDLPRKFEESRESLLNGSLESSGEICRKMDPLLFEEKKCFYSTKK